MAAIIIVVLSGIMYMYVCVSELGKGCPSVYDASILRVLLM
jgi:hypothetical protein